MSGLACVPIERFHTVRHWPSTSTTLSDVMPAALTLASSTISCALTPACLARGVHTCSSVEIDPYVHHLAGGCSHVACCIPFDFLPSSHIGSVLHCIMLSYLCPTCARVSGDLSPEYSLIRDKLDPYVSITLNPCSPFPLLSVCGDVHRPQAALPRHHEAERGLL